jgi:hypothetical protein
MIKLSSLPAEAERGFQFAREYPAGLDKGHITLEELLPVISRGGVYIGEDTHGNFNEFLAYISGLSLELHGAKEKAIIRLTNPSD